MLFVLSWKSVYCFVYMKAASAIVYLYFHKKKKIKQIQETKAESSLLG